ASRRRQTDRHELETRDHSWHPAERGGGDWRFDRVIVQTRSRRERFGPILSGYWRNPRLARQFIVQCAPDVSLFATCAHAAVKALELRSTIYDLRAPHQPLEPPGPRKS